MRTLLLLRHGKSDWNAEFQSDEDRPLAPRGIKAARHMGRFLSAAGSSPDLILSSPAVRARTTAVLAAEAGGWRCPMKVLPALYGGTMDDVLREVALQEDQFQTLLLAGHEPTWSLLCERLTGARARIPTACLVAIALGCESWAEAPTARGELRWLLPPRLLENRGSEGPT